jgi:hypothetical protein
MENSGFAKCNTITDKMQVDLDVLHPLVLNRI